MGLRIIELFGYAPDDSSAEAKLARKECSCPFAGGKCSKTLNDKTISGVCTVASTTGEPVVICPTRLYANEFRVLGDIAEKCFGAGARLIRTSEIAIAPTDDRNVVTFGHGWGKELRLPTRGKKGSYFVDWILANVRANGELNEFVAVEVQSIDTTGNYRDQRASFMANRIPKGASPAGLNWENVNKRILPQLIYKGHVLRQEPLCKHGLFFICPSAVYARIRERLGGELREYHRQPGAMTFQWYDLTEQGPAASLRGLKLAGQFTSTVDQVAHAFTAPANLPPAGSYEQAIRTSLGQG
jgi:hypothetical protein